VTALNLSGNELLTAQE